LDNARQILHDVIIPKSNRSVATFDKPLLPALIGVVLFGVLACVDFHNQLGL
jgi:hypothetical protein